MTMSYPATSFDTDHSALEGFADLMATGFENPEGITGTVRIVAPDGPSHGFLARFGPTLQIDWADTTTKADTVAVIPMATVHRIFAEFEWLDWRDPEIIGTIEFSGDLSLANHMAKSCIRPSQWTLDRFAAAADQHRRRGYRDLTDVPRLHDPSQAQILQAMADGMPVVVGGLESDPPCRDWTLDRLSTRFGDAIVRVRSASQRQTMRDFVAELKAFEADTFGDVIEGFRKPYTEGAALPPEMWSDFGPVVFDTDDFVPPQLWLGSVPIDIPTSGLHRDVLTGFLFQVTGRKRLDLYSADQADLLYPLTAFNNYQPCWFRPEAPDYDLYPKARNAVCLSVTLEPGELLIQPAGWFHQVYALDSPNLSVSYFWKH